LLGPSVTQQDNFPINLPQVGCDFSWLTGRSKAPSKDAAMHRALGRVWQE